MEVVAYVDDINLVTDDPYTLGLAIGQLKQYEQTFCLQMATSKSFLWGSEEVALQQLSVQWGFPIRRTVATLGSEWPLSPTRKCEYEKDLARLKQAEDRLIRLSHLPSKMTIKTAAIVTGILSLFHH